MLKITEKYLLQSKLHEIPNHLEFNRSTLYILKFSQD